MVTLERFQSTHRKAVATAPEERASEHPTLVQALGPLLILYLLYTMVRWAVVDRGEDVGDRNAGYLLRFETWLGIDFEHSVQNWTLRHPDLVSFFDHYYVFAFFPVLIVAAVWGYRAAPAAFHTARRVFAVSLAMALVIFALVPLAPPRLLSGHGYVDTLMLYGPRYYGDSSGASLFNAYGSIPSMVNEYAAMPSMHIGWSIIAGWLLYVASSRRWWVGALAATHVFLMETVVVATGNHYVIDGLVGMAVVVVSAAVVRRYEGRTRTNQRRLLHSARERA
jgi:hypothetical protein